MSARLLTAGEVAEFLGVPESWVRQETRKAEKAANGSGLPFLALGRYRRYSLEAVVDWLEGQRGGSWRKHRPKAAA